VPVLSNAEPVKVLCFPNLSTVDVGFPVEKLTLDSKNELSVDPTVLGMASEDELTIGSIVQRESYLTTATWATSNNVDDILFTSAVGPSLYDNDGATNSKLYMTPVCMAAALFNEWRGDLIFRFRFICSQYHKGRVRFSFDPSGYAGDNLTNDVNSTNVVFTQIVDLGKDSDIEVRVPYQQAASWLNTSQALTSGNIQWSTSLSPTFLYTQQYFNGTITLRVLTILTAPVATSSISILVSVRAADNFELANPINPPQNYSYFAPQSGEVRSEPVNEDMQMVVAGSQVHQPCPDRYRVNFGECITSFRAVMRRMCLSYVYLTNTTNSNPITILKQTQGKYPLYFGFDPNGIHTGKGIVTTGTTYPINFVNVLPYHWIAPAYIAQRGSVNWSFNVDSQSTIASIKMIRTPLLNSFSNAVLSQTIGSVSSNASYYRLNSDPGCSGQALTNQYTQAGLNVQLPNYGPYRWQSTAPNSVSAPYGVDYANQDLSTLEVDLANTPAVESTNTKIWKYVGIGTDWSCHFFLNAPTLYEYSAQSVPV